MEYKNIVFIGHSIDGRISDRNGGLDWLQSVPNPDNIDMGYGKLMDEVDALVMGRTTFEVVCSFDMEWPYTKPVFVLSRTMESVPEPYSNKAALLKGSLDEVLAQIHEKGHKRLYIDGGGTIQGFLKEDLIDEMVLTTIPVLLGGGAPLFADLPKELKFELVESTVYLDAIVQNRYRRKR